MSDFQFNCMTTANYLMNQANKQHHLSVHQVNQRRYDRAIMRCAREIRRANILSAAVTTAILIGMVVAAWFLSAVAAN